MHKQSNKEIRPSIIDRLIDNEPQTRVESQIGRAQYLRDLRNSVKRDLESLLNSRYKMVSPPEHLHQLEKSLVNYGLPDLSTVNIQDLDKRKLFIKNLEKIIAIYEPRFKSIKVRYIDNKETSDRSLRFRIDATLYADPAPEVIVFDSVLDPIFRAVTVKESYNG